MQDQGYVSSSIDQPISFKHQSKLQMALQVINQLTFERVIQITALSNHYEATFFVLQITHLLLNNVPFSYKLTYDEAEKLPFTHMVSNGVGKRISTFMRQFPREMFEGKMPMNNTNSRNLFQQFKDKMAARTKLIFQLLNQLKQSKSQLESQAQIALPQQILSKEVLKQIEQNKSHLTQTHLTFISNNQNPIYSLFHRWNCLLLQTIQKKTQGYKQSK